MDKETAKQMDEGQKLYNFVQDETWQRIKKQLVDKVLETGNILTISQKDPNTTFLELAARQEAIKMVLEWIGEVEGQVEQYKNFTSVYSKEQRSYIYKV